VVVPSPPPCSALDNPAQLLRRQHLMDHTLGGGNRLAVGVIDNVFRSTARPGPNRRLSRFRRQSRRVADRHRSRPMAASLGDRPGVFERSPKTAGLSPRRHSLRGWCSPHDPAATTCPDEACAVVKGGLRPTGRRSTCSSPIPGTSAVSVAWSETASRWSGRRLLVCDEAGAASATAATHAAGRTRASDLARAGVAGVATHK
jgi:hypothetical protein